MFAILPGALATWGFEREAGAWGAGLADRVLRFLGWSAVLHAVAAPVTFLLWRECVRDPPGQTTSPLIEGKIPFWAWPVFLGYLVLPLLGGTVVGRASRHQRSWAKALVGEYPVPTAWEHVIRERPSGIIRIRLKSKVYAGGLFQALDNGETAYAAGYSSTPLDIWLVRVVVVDADTGQFILRPDGSPQVLDSGMLVRYEEIETLELTPM